MNGDKQRVLLVEDDSGLSLATEFALKNEGFGVMVADTVGKAKELFQKDSFDLILLDVMLPDSSGYDLCKEIRENGSNIPIIFLTACDEEVNIVMGLDIGGDDYITKPFRIRELVSRIKAVLRRRIPELQTNASDFNMRKKQNSSISDIDENEDIPETTLKNAGKYSIITVGEIELNLEAARVRKNNQEIFLSVTEYKLLLALIKNAGRIMTRNVLLEALWDIDGEFVDDNTLSVYIRRLRDKIEDDANAPKYIITQRGLGYIWKK